MNNTVYYLYAIVLSISSISAALATSQDNDQLSQSTKSRILGITFKPNIVRHVDLPSDERVEFCHQDRQTSRTELSFGYINFDDKNCKYIISGGVDTYNIDIKKFQQGIQWDLTSGMAPSVTQVEYFYSNKAVHFKCEGLEFGSCLFDVDGNITFRAQTMNFSRVCLWPQGKIKLYPLQSECPLEKIVIVPGNNQKTTVIDVTLSPLQNSWVDFEIINVSRIIMEFKKGFTKGP